MPFIVKVESSFEHPTKIEDYVYEDFDIAFDQVCKDLKELVKSKMETFFISETYLKIEDIVGKSYAFEDGIKQVKVAELIQSEDKIEWFIYELKTFQE